MQIVIKKAEIMGSLFLKYEFEQIDVNVKNNIKTSSDAPIHEDLRTAFRKLIPHFAYICEEVRNQEVVKQVIEDHDTYLSDRETSPNDTFFKYRVYGFLIKENKGYETVAIQGSKQLENSEEINFTTYPVDLSDTDYDFLDQLNATLEELKSEVLLYMQGKSAPKAQLEMFGGEEEEDPDFD